MQALLKAQINKTDRNDARGIAQMIRAGLYRKTLTPLKSAIDTWPLQPAQVLNGGGQQRSMQTFPIEPGPKWPKMWRVKLPDGGLTDTSSPAKWSMLRFSF